MGDLLFQDLDSGPLCDAIEAVTEGVDGAEFSHVGMISRVDRGGVYVIEAIPEGVVETPLDTFLARGRDSHGDPKVLVGRMRPAYARLLPEAVAAALELRGRPYDRVFAVDNDAYYCSELICEAFRRANGGRLVFSLAPMTFIDPATGFPFDAWTTYFADLGIPIPEGQPGLNPGGMSREPFVEIVHAYGVPSGWQTSRCPPH